MQISLRVKIGSRRDELWREGSGLYLHIRTVEPSDDANPYLIKFLSGRLRVAQGLIALREGPIADQKVLDINIRDTDMQPILDTLPIVPAARLFDDV